MIPRVYLDTNVFIAAFETAGSQCDHAWRVLNEAESGRLTVVTSELTLAELLSKPPPDGPLLTADYDQMITSKPGLQVQPVSRAVLLEAAAIRRGMPSLRLPDAIHLATAKLARCEAFLTGDMRLTKYPPLNIVRLSPNSLDELHEADGS